MTDGGPVDEVLEIEKSHIVHHPWSAASAQREKSQVLIVDAHDPTKAAHVAAAASADASAASTASTAGTASAVAAVAAAVAPPLAATAAATEIGNPKEQLEGNFSVKAISLAVKRARLETYINLYFAPDQPLVIQFVLDTQQGRNVSEYSTWCARIKRDALAPYVELSRDRLTAVKTESMIESAMAATHGSMDPAEISNAIVYENIYPSRIPSFFVLSSLTLLVALIETKFTVRLQSNTRLNARPRLKPCLFRTRLCRNK